MGSLLKDCLEPTLWSFYVACGFVLGIGVSLDELVDSHSYPQRVERYKVSGYLEETGEVEMGVKVDEGVWETALAYCKNGIVRDFVDHSNEVFWREYDLQSRMYGRMFEQTILRPYLRREHRIWTEDGSEQLLVMDMALLDPENEDRKYPYWPVKEMIQLKFPVEFITGLTEPQDLTLREDAPTQATYIERCRTRIRKKIWEDYQKFEKAVGKARNISASARCDIIYSDLSNKPSYPSSEEMMRDFRDTKGVDVIRIGSWPLTLRYAHVYPRDRRRSAEGSRSRGGSFD